MFLEGYRPLTSEEVNERMGHHENTANELSLDGEAKRIYLDTIRKKVEQEFIHVLPIENKPRIPKTKK